MSAADAAVRCGTVVVSSKEVTSTSADRPNASIDRSIDKRNTAKQDKARHCMHGLARRNRTRLCEVLAVQVRKIGFLIAPSSASRPAAARQAYLSGAVPLGRLGSGLQ